MFNELEGRKGITNQVSRFHLPATSPYPLQGEAQRASTTSQTARIQEARLWASKYKQGDDSDFNVPHQRGRTGWVLARMQTFPTPIPQGAKPDSWRKPSQFCPHPQACSTSTLLPVYGSRSYHGSYQRESRHLNMSTHDITWKSWLPIGASYNLPGSRKENRLALITSLFIRLAESSGAPAKIGFQGTR